MNESLNTERPQPIKYQVGGQKKIQEQVNMDNQI